VQITQVKRLGPSAATMSPAAPLIETGLQQHSSMRLSGSAVKCVLEAGLAPPASPGASGPRHGGIEEIFARLDNGAESAQQCCRVQRP
jgi:hypothetical protein